MRDELFDRDYQAGRDALHKGIERIAAEIGRTFRAIHAIQFDAPWNVRRASKPGRTDCA